MDAATEGFDVVEEEVQAGGLRLTVAHPRDAEELIDEDAYAVDERLPYWAELWPSARALADTLATAPLRGARVVELGCGVGLPALVAAMRGARVLATDWYDEALGFTARNAARAGVDVQVLRVDWREPPPALLAAAPFDWVVAADVLYEERNGGALAALLPRLCGPATRVLIADPRRPHVAALLDPLRAMGWGHEAEEVPVRGRRDESGGVIRLHRLTPPMTRAARER